jgi:carbon storage regulator
MLVLTRKLMEKLYIGDEICVTVVRLEGGQVRLGIDAPRDIPVVRAELVDHPRVGSSARRAEPTAAAGEGNPPAAARAGPEPHAESVTIRPDAARGIDIRRRGPSR